MTHLFNTSDKHYTSASAKELRTNIFMDLNTVIDFLQAEENYELSLLLTQEDARKLKAKHQIKNGPF